MAEFAEMKSTYSDRAAVDPDDIAMMQRRGERSITIILKAATYVPSFEFDSGREADEFWEKVIASRKEVVYPSEYRGKQNA